MITITKLAGQTKQTEDFPPPVGNVGMIQGFAADPLDQSKEWKRMIYITPSGLVCKSTTGGLVVIPIEVLGDFFAAADPNLRPPQMKEGR